MKKTLIFVEQEDEDDFQQRSRKKKITQFKEYNFNIDDDKQFWLDKRTKVEEYLIQEAAKEDASKIPILQKKPVGEILKLEPPKYQDLDVLDFEQPIQMTRLHENILQVKGLTQLEPAAQEDDQPFIEMKPEIKEDFMNQIEDINERWELLRLDELQDKQSKQQNGQIEQFAWSRVKKDALALWEVEKIRIELLKHKYFKQDDDIQEAKQPTTTSLNKIDQVIKKNQEQKPHYELIDSFIKRLKFFKKYGKHIRMSLLKKAQYVFCPKNKFLFRQGDVGDFMYIILQGCIEVIETKISNWGEQQNLLVSLYDGQHFGELALMGTTLNKTHTNDIDHMKKQIQLKQLEINKKIQANQQQEIEHSDSLARLEREKKLEDLVQKEERMRNEQYQNIGMVKSKRKKQPNEVSDDENEDDLENNGDDKDKAEDSKNDDNKDDKSNLNQDNQIITIETDNKSKERKKTVNIEGTIEEQQQNDDEKKKKEKQYDYYERTRRLASTKAAEDTHLIAIPRDYFKETLLKLIQQELDKKLKILINLRFFSQFEPFALIPIANNLGVKIFKYGEIILREGEISPCLYILANGQCKLVKENLEIRNKHPSQHLKLLQKAQKDFKFGEVQYKEMNDYRHSSNKKKKNNIPLEVDVSEDQILTEIDELQRSNYLAGVESKFKYQKESAQNSQNQSEQVSIKSSESSQDQAVDNDDRNKYVMNPQIKRLYSFCKDTNIDDPNLISYYNIVEYGKLTYGDIFGGKALLEIPNIQKQAKLTIVSDSFNTECYVLEKKKLVFISEFLQRTLKNGLKSQKEWDDIDVLQERNINQKWAMLRNKIYKDELQNRNRGSDQLKNYKKY